MGRRNNFIFWGVGPNFHAFNESRPPCYIDAIPRIGVHVFPTSGCGLTRRYVITSSNDLYMNLCAIMCSATVGSEQGKNADDRSQEIVFLLFFLLFFFFLMVNSISHVEVVEV